MASVLVVCTANRCRSPLGEALLRQQLADHGHPDITVSSAGFLPDGWPAEPEVGQVLRERGLDVSAHRSRTLTQAIVDDADVIVTMERGHVRELAVRFKAFPKAFTLKDFAQRASNAPARRDEAFPDWVARLHVGRTTAGVMGHGPDEVADPIGNPVADYERCRDELEATLATLVQALPHRSATPELD